MVCLPNLALSPIINLNYHSGDIVSWRSPFLGHYTPFSGEIRVDENCFNNGDVSHGKPYFCSDADINCSIMDIQHYINIRKPQEIILAYFLLSKKENVG